MQENRNKLKTVIITMAVLLILSAGGLAGLYHACLVPMQAAAAASDNLTEKAASPRICPTLNKLSVFQAGGRPAGTSFTGETAALTASRRADADKPQAAGLTLYQGRPSDNQRFEAGNLFPGDSVTKYFCVKAYHDADVTLFFRADITDETKSLGNVLHIKVTHMETGKVLCDAPFAAINGKEFSELLKQNAQDETTAYYQVDVSLDTSVGNDYQAARLQADFSWYVKDESGLIPPPQTGDGFHPLLLGTLAAASLLMIFLQKRGKRRERYA